jgi:hypothetical protein
VSTDVNQGTEQIVKTYRDASFTTSRIGLL